MNTQKAEFKKKVKHWLVDEDKSVSWLCNEITNRTGKFCNSSYLSKILNGERIGRNITDAIEQITGIKYGGD